MEYTIKELLEIPEETQNIEFKRLVGEKVVAKIIETIVAMANTDGGIIVFGIDDPEKSSKKGLDRVFGIEENKELFDEIGREIQKIVPPIGDLWSPAYLEADNGKTIAIIEISKAMDSFRAINKQVYQRLNKGNKHLNPNEIIKLSYAKGFEKADRILVDVDFDLLNTEYYKMWKNNRGIERGDIKEVLSSVGLAKKNNDGKRKPTIAALLLFAEYPTYLTEMKSSVRVFQYIGNKETIGGEVPNLLGAPKSIDGPIIKQIKDTHEYVLLLLRSGIFIPSGFTTKYKIPERAVKEAITNAIIHRDYYLKRDIEISIFEDRIEIENAGLFPYNITSANIGKIRSEGYRNDLLVKHLREFPNPPNLDQNEGVKTMRIEMFKENLLPPIYVTYPALQDSVKVILWNEAKPNDWEKIKDYLNKNKYITNEKAREITGTIQSNSMSMKLRKFTEKGLLVRIPEDVNVKKDVKYKLALDME